jgi:hypothetical protein
MNPSSSVLRFASGVLAIFAGFATFELLDSTSGWAVFAVPIAAGLVAASTYTIVLAAVRPSGQPERTAERKDAHPDHR